MIHAGAVVPQRNAEPSYAQIQRKRRAVCVGTVHVTELKNNIHIASAACP